MNNANVFNDGSLDLFKSMFGINDNKNQSNNTELPKTFNDAYDRICEGEFFEEKDVLQIKDEYGWTIAHVQVYRGWITDDKEILNLKDDTGKMVRDVKRREL